MLQQELPSWKLQPSSAMSSWETGVFRRRRSSSRGSRSASRRPSGEDGTGSSTWTSLSSRGLQDPDYDVIQPEGRHECTVIYLYGGDSRTCAQYTEEDRSFPWQSGTGRAPSLRTVLVDIQQLDFQRMESRRSWGVGSRSNRAGDPQALEATRQWIGQIVQDEVELLGNARHVFLGGIMQGCTLALDIYLREARRLRLGGFVGSVGFIPNDRMGFEGASKALEVLAGDSEQSHRPVWLQCTTDDNQYAPWRSVVKPSLARATSLLPGLLVREVAGLGNGLLGWEAQILSKFLHEHAPYAYNAAPKAAIQQQTAHAAKEDDPNIRRVSSTEWVVSV